MKWVSFAGAACGVLSGIGMICAAIMGSGNIPKPVWALIAVGWLIAVSAQIYTFCCLNKNKGKK